jgi:uncharacterized protein YjbJ (UPF0337 family)
MDQRAGQLSQPEDEDDALAAGDAEILQTRQEMSETLEAIQEKLAPERLTEDAKDTVDHAIEEAKAAAQEWSEIASVAAMEAVDHAMSKLKETFPDLSHQAQETASVAVDHAIGEAKAAVRELGEQARAAVRDATIGKVERMANTTSETSKYVGSTTMQTIKQNPGPAALAALGIGWLMMSGKNSGSQAVSTGSSSSSSGSQATTNGMGDKATSIANNAQETASTVAGQVTDTASSVADQVTETATDVAGQVTDTVTSAAGHVQETASQVATQAQQAPSRLRHMIEENPVPLGLVALALGGAAALAVPESRRENELMGEARDTLFDRAQTAAQTTVQKVQNVVEEVGETVEKEAQYQGLTPDDK